MEVVKITRTATELFEHAFECQRDIRSKEYKAGVLAALKFKCGEAGEIPRPYVPGTVEYDAYGAGIDEGKTIYLWAMRPNQAEDM